MVRKPILVFSLSLDKVEQYWSTFRAVTEYEETFTEQGETQENPSMDNISEDQEEQDNSEEKWSTSQKAILP